MNKLPALFIAHWSPMNIIESNEFTESLIKLSTTLPKPELILIISAHWLTKWIYITNENKWNQIYDFYWFPDELYQYKYNYKGSKEWANKIIESMSEYNIQTTENWWLDHWGWSILKYLFPNADIPVIQISIDCTKHIQQHYQIWKALGKLRNEWVMVIWSWNIVHNLEMIDFHENASPYSWAVEFDSKIKQFLEEKNHDWLINYFDLWSISKLSQPTNEHFIPLIYISWMQESWEKIKFIYEWFQNKSISMTSFIVQ